MTKNLGFVGSAANARALVEDLGRGYEIRVSDRHLLDRRHRKRGGDFENDFVTQSSKCDAQPAALALDRLVGAEGSSLPGPRIRLGLAAPAQPGAVHSPAFEEEG